MLRQISMRMAVHLPNGLIRPISCAQLKSVQLNLSRRSQLRSYAMSSENLRKFGVFVAGHASEYTQRSYGGYGQMLANLLKDADDNWEVFHVVDDEFPCDSRLDEFEGFVISGSRHDAHSNESWIEKLCGVLQILHHKKKKILGVCFGHQVLSRALGGKTGRAAVGWEIGLKEMDVRKEMASLSYGIGLPSRLKLFQSHRDQVLELPEGGILLGSSSRTPIEMFAVDDHVLGVQGHPEFTKDVLQDIIRSRHDAQILSDDEVREAIDSLGAAGEDDKEALTKMLKTFLHKP